MWISPLFKPEHEHELWCRWGRRGKVRKTNYAFLWVASLGRGGVVLRHKECKLRRFLGEVCHSHSSCWDPQHTQQGLCVAIPKRPSQRTVLSALPCCLSRKNVTIYKMKGYLRGIKNYLNFFQLIGVVRYFSCCQRFDICVFTRLHFISASLRIKVMYLSVFWPHGWCSKYCTNTNFKFPTQAEFQLRSI